MTPTPLPNYDSEYFMNPLGSATTTFTDNNVFAGTLSYELDYRDQANTNVQIRSLQNDVPGSPSTFTMGETFVLPLVDANPTSWERLWMFRMLGFGVTGGSLSGTPGALTSRSRWFYAHQPSSAPAGAVFPSAVLGFLPLGSQEPFGFVDNRGTGGTPPSYKYDLIESIVGVPASAVEIGKLEHGVTGGAMSVHGPTPVNTTRYRVQGPGNMMLEVRPSRNYLASNGGPVANGNPNGRTLIGPTTSATYMSSPNPTPTP